MAFIDHFWLRVLFLPMTNPDFIKSFINQFLKFSLSLGLLLIVIHILSRKNLRKLIISCIKIVCYYITILGLMITLEIFWKEDVISKNNQILINKIITTLQERIYHHIDGIRTTKLLELINEIYAKIKHVLAWGIIIWLGALLVQIGIWALSTIDGICSSSSMDSVKYLQVLWLQPLSLWAEQIHALKYMLWFVGLESLILILIGWFFCMISFWGKISLFISKLFVALGFVIMLLAMAVQVFVGC